MPTANDTITVNYRGFFVNGTEFVSSYKDKKPTSASLSRVIPGWKEAMQLMREGSRWQLFIPPELAYGQKGATGIEPNSALIFDVDLISVTPGAESPNLAANLRAKHR
jgi:FKBP-type peptidyl-prolyl cis-trans isomerase